MPDLISRKEALSLQRRRFYTSKPCKYGHDSERYVVNGACILCVNPKLDPATLPPPLEKFKLPNGRIVDVITQDEAYRRGWKVYFTGQPCSEGHMSERNTKSGRCLQCMHPPKYGPDAYTGWWPFQPKPPLRVPPQTPLTVWEGLARKVQEAIPRFLQELEAEGVAPVSKVVEREVLSILTCPHFSEGKEWSGLKLWWPYTEGARGDVPHKDPRVRNRRNPWVRKDGGWYALDHETKELIKL